MKKIEIENLTFVEDAEDDFSKWEGFLPDNCLSWKEKGAPHKKGTWISIRNRKLNKTPTDEQIQALRYNIDHSEAIRKNVLAAIIEDWDEICPHYPGRSFPSKKEIEQKTFLLEDMLSNPSVTILEAFSHECSYTELSFNSEIDFEHGYSVLIHKDRVVSTAGDCEIYINADIASGPIRHHYGSAGYDKL